MFVKQMFAQLRMGFMQQEAQEMIQTWQAKLPAAEPGKSTIFLCMYLTFSSYHTTRMHRKWPGHDSYKVLNYYMLEPLKKSIYLFVFAPVYLA